MICTDNNKLRQLIARDDKRLKDISGPLTGAQRKTNQIRKAKRGDRNEEAVLNEFNIASNTSYTNQSPTSSGTFQFPTPITTTNFHPSLYNSYTNPLYNLPSSLHNTHTNSSLNGSYMHLANLYIHSPTHPPTYPSYLLLTLLLTLLLNLYTQPTYLNNSNTSLLEILGKKNNNEESKRRKMDGEDYKPYFHVKIPPPRVVTPPHLPRTPEHQTFSLSYFVSPTTSESEETDSDDSDAMTRIMMTMIRREFYWTIQLRLMKMVKKIPSVSKEEYICAICIISLKSMANGVRIGFIYRNRLPSLSHILLLQADYFSDLQIEQFSKGTLTILQECIETALDEDLRLKEAERIVEQSFTKTFNDPVDQKKLERMRFIFLQLTKNIPVTSVTINI
ncbi:unnamed protein product [Rhizophagus irregularis]|nr:unnamed protein product [Rhizophagus irregularis]